jgi:heme A synthase
MTDPAVIERPTVDRGMIRLALAAALSTLLMIVIGAITRVTDSGMGCGTHWPLCNGHLIPEFESMAVVVEYGHRIFALPIGLFGLLVFVQALRRHRSDPRVLYPATLGFVLFFVQSGLGMVTVKLYNQWLSVLLHLGNSMFLLACYLVVWVSARKPGVEPETVRSPHTARLPLVEVVLAAALTFVVAIVGAAVAGNNAAKACVGWPLCAGEIWPVGQGPLQTLNMLHRLVAGGLGILLILMLIQSWSGNINRTARNAIVTAFVLYLLQAALGALVVWINTPELLGTVRALHVLFAALTWSMMVIASGISWLQQPLASLTASQSGRVGVPSATTSS